MDNQYTRNYRINYMDQSMTK